MQSRIIGPTLAAVAIVVLAACGGNAAASLAPGIASNALPSAAAPSEAASTAASEAPSEAAASGAAVIPSFAYPSSDKELEALLPDKVCGATAVKLSFSGATFAATGDAELKALLTALGKSPADVSMAVAAAPGAGKCAAGIFRVKGADPSRLQQVFQAEAAKSGDVYVVKSIGGKDVYVATGGSDSSLQYAYIAGDALVFVAADTEAQAAELIAALP